MGKKKLTVYVSEETYNLLQSLAPQLHGRPYGSISAIVEEALKRFLLPRLHTQKHANPSRSVRLVYEAVVEKIKEITNEKMKPYEVMEKVLDLAIMETRGSDRRTVEKWKTLFEKAGLIKFVGGSRPNRVVELL